MRKRQRHEFARGWIASGAAVTIESYARRYGVDRYTAYEDLTVLGFPLPAAGPQWAQRPPPTARPRRRPADVGPPDTHWIMLDGRSFFVAGYTPAGFPYGIYEDETHDDVHDVDDDSDQPLSFRGGDIARPHDDRRATAAHPSTVARGDTTSRPAPI
jgi:hypothetical protein